MANPISHTWNTYKSNMSFVLLSALAFAIAFIVPVFASLPTYNDMGGIFLRTSSIYLNLNTFNSAVIIIAFLFSLLFISFAMVVINVIVKHSRTRTKIKQEVVKALERSTGRVFIIFLIYSLLIFCAGMVGYSIGHSAILAAVVSIVLVPLVFYAPSSVVIDEKGIVRSMHNSATFFFKRLDYFAIWMVLALVALTVLDFVLVHVAGTNISRYAMLAISSVFLLPFLMLLQGEFYISRFRLLK
jgi:hypothetical protein